MPEEARRDSGAYRLGREATNILDNPFKDDTIEFRKWVDGWYDAFIERREANKKES